MAEAESEFRRELERVLSSDALRSSDSLRRLLQYLGEAHLAGTGRNLKEYTIGRDVMGKPEDYDPRVDASVRVQVGKLRQRLEQYYRTEAAESALEIKLPKGHFELVIEERPEADAPASGTGHGALNRWKGIAAGLGAVCVVLAVLGGWLWVESREARNPMAGWTPEMREFWEPFIESRRPMLVVLGSPLFIRFHHDYYRNPWVNEWPEAEKTLPLREMEKLLGSKTPASETHRWTPFGEAMAAFRLARVLGPLKEDMELKRSSVMAWEDVRASNLVFLGPPKFNPQLNDLPVSQDFVIEQGGVTNRRPRPGEQAVYRRTAPPELDEIPEDYSVITRIRGVEGWGEILVLACSSTEGAWAAVDYVTRPAHLKDLMARLKAAGGGKAPDSYQVLLKCRFKSQVPIGVEYLTHHVLGPPGSKGPN